MTAARTDLNLWANEKEAADLAAWKRDGDEIELFDVKSVSVQSHKSAEYFLAGKISDTQRAMRVKALYVYADGRVSRDHPKL